LNLLQWVRILYLRFGTNPNSKMKLLKYNGGLKKHYLQPEIKVLNAKEN